MDNLSKIRRPELRKWSQRFAVYLVLIAGLLGLTGCGDGGKEIHATETAAVATQIYHFNAMQDTWTEGLMTLGAPVPPEALLRTPNPRPPDR